MTVQANVSNCDDVWQQLIYGLPKRSLKTCFAI